MKRINDREVELTEGEQVLKEIVAGITEDDDTKVLDLLTEIRDQVPLDGKVFALLSNADFCLYLADIQDPHDCQPADLEYQGEVGAPGFGQSWKCRECQAPWGRIGEHFFRHEEDGEPSNILSLEDTR